jgi:hypothetical protein
MPKVLKAPRLEYVATAVEFVIAESGESAIEKVLPRTGGDVADEPPLAAHHNQRGSPFDGCQMSRPATGVSRGLNTACR